MLILNKPICGGTLYTCLQLVPQELHNIFFIAFHTNAIGGHLTVYWMLQRLRLHFYWPGMYAYVKRMCQACPSWALSNPSRGKCSELVYNFPIDASFLVMHFNPHIASKHAGFKGSDIYLIGCCRMCSFPCIEPITNPSSSLSNHAYLTQVWLLPHSCAQQGQQVLRCLPQGLGPIPN
jgi:hypothetical protein